MCGGYSNTVGPEELGRQVGGPLGVKIRERTLAELPRYNIAPRDPVLGIVAADGVPQARVLKWGLIPPRAREVPKKTYINATLEELKNKGSYLSTPADAAHRALLIADEFQEWVKAEQKNKVRPAPSVSGLMMAGRSASPRYGRQRQCRGCPGGKRHDPDAQVRRQPCDLQGPSPLAGGPARRGAVVSVA